MTNERITTAIERARSVLGRERSQASQNENLVSDRAAADEWRAPSAPTQRRGGMTDMQVVNLMHQLIEVRFEKHNDAIERDIDEALEHLVTNELAEMVSAEVKRQLQGQISGNDDTNITSLRGRSDAA